MQAQQALELSQTVAPNTAQPEYDVRRQLAKRLSDVICIPASHLTPQERHMAGDVLVELLRDADVELRESVAKRLVRLNEAPRTILLSLPKTISKSRVMSWKKAKVYQILTLFKFAAKSLVNTAKLLRSAVRCLTRSPMPLLNFSKKTS